MWEYRTCITWSSYQPLTGYHIWSHMTARRQETSIVNWLVGFPLIRATRWRFFNALSDRRFRTNQRADSAYHLISDKAGKWHLILFLETYSQRFALTSCRQRTGSRVHRRPTATSSSLLASRQALQGSADQRWRRRRWASPLKSSLWLGSTPPLETMRKRQKENHWESQHTQSALYKQHIRWPLLRETPLMMIPDTAIPQKNLKMQ